MKNPYLEEAYTGKEETARLIDEVVECSFESVVSTLGPNANLALIIERNRPVVTKDGVRVARALDFNEIRKNSIAHLITSAAIKTDELVGDGTTTTVFMVHGLYNKFKGSLDFSTSRFIDKLVKMTRDKLAEMITEVTPNDDKFTRMVYTTSNYQEIIADTVIGLLQQYKSPKFTLKRGVGHTEDVVDVYKDIVFEGKYASPHLSPNAPRGNLLIDQSATLLLDNQITDINEVQLKALLDLIVKTKVPLTIVARHFENNVLDAMISLNTVVNRTFGIPDKEQKLYVVPYVLHVAGTAGGNVFKDMGQMFETQIYSNFPDRETIADLSKNLCSNVAMDMKGIKFDTGDKIIKERAEKVLSTLEPVFEGMTITEKASILGKLLQNRIGRLRAENITITVSGMTDAEISERFYLYEDACRVAETSLRFGVIPGIGYGFNQVAEMINNEVIKPLNDKFNAHTHTSEDKLQLDVARDYIDVLVSQYEYLTGKVYKVGERNEYLDLVRDEVSDVPEFVFDNGCAAMSAIESAWSVVKRLNKISVILGRSDRTYNL